MELVGGSVVVEGVPSLVVCPIDYSLVHVDQEDYI